MRTHLQNSLGLVLAALAVVALGCGPGKTPDANPPKPPVVHDHPEKGPHNGQLLELGTEEYHAELIHDDAKHTVTIYLLDSKAAKPVTTAATEIVINAVVADKPTQFKLPAAPQMGDPMGQTSCFSITDQALCEALDDPGNKARVNITIGDKPYTADLAGHAHDHGHDHDHDKEKK